MGTLDEAQSGYEHALALAHDDAARARGMCAYAEFLEMKRGDRKRACVLQRKASCPSQTACVVLPASL